MIFHLKKKIAVQKLIKINKILEDIHYMMVSDWVIVV
jgi:hypothetical protein